MSASNQTWNWLLRLDDIVEGQSAILGGNKLVFYLVHCTGLIVVLISLICCSSVIISICRNAKKTASSEFSDRFPLYLAISDSLWAICNLCGDHAILVITQVFPEKKLATLLAVNVFLFFGYQQLMSIGLSIYTYFRVVRRTSLNLGKWDWKLHATVVFFLLTNTALYLYWGTLGNAGYWFLADMRSVWGIIMAANICTICSLHAISTLVVYRAVQKVISSHSQKRIMSSHIPYPSVSSSSDLGSYNKGIEKNNKKKPTYCDPIQSKHSTAFDCLNTFVYISLCLYFPFAVATWAFFMFGVFGYLEPITCLLIGIAANSGGLANCIGYFHNRKIKERRRTALQNNFNKTNICSTSTSSGSNV